MNGFHTKTWSPLPYHLALYVDSSCSPLTAHPNLLICVFHNCSLSSAMLPPLYHTLRVVYRVRRTNWEMWTSVTTQAPGQKFAQPSPTSSHRVPWHWHPLNTSSAARVATTMPNLSSVRGLFMPYYTGIIHSLDTLLHGLIIKAHICRISVEQIRGCIVVIEAQNDLGVQIN